MPHSAEFHVLLQALIALVLGGALGWEREAAGKQVGLRTQMLVCLATMLFVRLGQTLIAQSTNIVTPAEIRADPIHIIAAIGTGISFLGAGTIFHARGHSRGLTTAACLLVTSCIGIAVAMELYIIAVGVTVLCLFVLHTLHRYELSVRAFARAQGANQEADDDDETPPKVDPS